MKYSLPWRKLVVPVVILVVFWSLAIWAFLASGFAQPLILFGYIGTSLGLGLGLYAILPKPRKHVGRKITLFMVGAFLVSVSIVMAQENSQIEGLFFSILAGVMQMAVMHYLIAKIFGPLLFGRLWCGWACWTMLLLELLPFTRSTGRLPAKWGWIRYVHLVASLALVLLLWFGFGFRDGATGPAAVVWFVVGNLIYYFMGILLAFALKDNRAFCKYLCPVSVPLKLTSRFSLIKIKGAEALCNDCGACVKACPMDIRITDYIKAGQRVLSTECTLCQTCIAACNQNALKLSFGFDWGGREHLRTRG